MSSANRPKRQSRVPTKQPLLVAPPQQPHPSTSKTNSESKLKRKKTSTDISELDAEGLIDFLLTDPKSKLCNMPITDVINEDNWYRLTPTARNTLCQLLPSNFFANYQPTVDYSHPSSSAVLSNVEQEASVNVGNIIDAGLPLKQNTAFELTEEELSIGPWPHFMTDPSFCSACSTFQDHVYSGWYRSAHQDKLVKFRDKIISASGHIPWKDQVWLHDHRPRQQLSQSFTFYLLTRYSLLLPHDILSYAVSPTFSIDVLLHSITSTKAASHLTFYLPPLDHSTLPSSFILGTEVGEDEEVIETVVVSPSELSAALLFRLSSQLKMSLNLNSGDHSDNREDERKELKKWKVYRWDPTFQREVLPLLRDSGDELLGKRGGRVFIGTLEGLRRIVKGKKRK